MFVPILTVTYAGTNWNNLFFSIHLIKKYFKYTTINIGHIKHYIVNFKNFVYILCDPTYNSVKTIKCL